jgi:DNA polymerase III psi subunit
MFAAAQQPTLFQERLSNTVEPLRSALAGHRIYGRLNALGPLRAFMESHVFAVWDFMSLVKTLQQRLTCVQAPWQPPSDTLSARLINEIVLAEESDQFADGQYESHFELYLRAMEEVGANTQPMRAFMHALRAGHAVASALAHAGARRSTTTFVMNTMATVDLETHEVAASFLLGREAVIPLMFEQVLSVTARIDAPMLNWYLARHIEVDGDEHGPAGWRLLAQLCGTNAKRWKEAEISATRALEARRALWDAVCGALELRAGIARI